MNGAIEQMTLESDRRTKHLKASAGAVERLPALALAHHARPAPARNTRCIRELPSTRSRTV
jgi:hypothetical protein